MEELKNNEVRADVPAEISTWTKIKNFLFQEITLTMTPKQELVFQEVHDFGTKKLIVIFGFKKLKL